MQVEIEYCGMWGYEARARAARTLIASRQPQAQVTLRKSSGGVFEITVDGTLRYSKRKTGAFPSEAEVAQAVA